MTTRKATLQTIGILLLAAFVSLPFDPTPGFWMMMGCFLSAICAIWIAVFITPRV